MRVREQRWTHLQLCTCPHLLPLLWHFHSGQHPNWFLPSAWGLAPWSSMSITQLNLIGHTTGTWVSITKLSSHAHLCLLPQPLYSSSLPQEPHCFQQVLGRGSKLGNSPFSNLSYVYIILPFFPFIPILQIFPTTDIGLSTSTTTYDYYNCVSQLHFLQAVNFLKYNLICYCRFWLNTAYISAIPSPSHVTILSNTNSNC